MTLPTAWIAGSGDGNDIYAYYYWIQYWCALRLRARALGRKFFPTPDEAQTNDDNGIWDSGTTATVSLSGTTLTATMTITDAWTPAAYHSSDRWVGYSCTGTTTQCCPSRTIPQHYDIVWHVVEDDPSQVVRCAITAQSGGSTPGGTGTLTIDATNAVNAVTAGWISDISDLAGKDYYIVGQGKSWWSDRWPEFPNDNELWLGTCTSGTGTRDVSTGDATTYLIITDTVATWGAEQWATGDSGSFDLLVFDSGILKRLEIIHNDGTNLYVASGSETAPAGAYSIVASGATGQPGRKKWRMLQWKQGETSAAYAHDATDSISFANIVRNSYLYSSGNPCGAGECTDYTATLGDNDFKVDLGELCAGSLAGRYLNVDLYKSIRGLQNYILANCGYFVPPISYDGSAAINPFTPASFFNYLGINNGSSTTAVDTDHSIYFTVGSDYYGVPVYYEVFDTSGKHKGSGTATPDASTGKVSPVDNCGYTDGTHNDGGLNVVYSAGWTRYRPRWFKYLYPKWGFIPDVSGETSLAIDPPSVTTDPTSGHYVCDGAGTIVRRAASTGGVVVSGGMPYDSAEPFITGELYHYTGDNFRDPFPSGFNSGDSDAHLALLPYEDGFYRGNLSKDNQAARNASRSGKVSGGAKSSFTQSDHDWGTDWRNGGILRTESGTATGGSTTTLIDSSKDTTDPTKPWSCWYADVRWATGLDPFAGLPIQIKRTHSGSDLTIDATNNLKVTSGAYSFSYLDAGTKMTISAATGWTAGDYIIASVDSGAAILATSPATAGTVGTAAWTMTTIIKRIVTGCTTGAGGATFTFDALDGLTVVSGDVWQIDEPKYEANKWEGRQVVITAPDGTKTDPIAITNSDNDSLFFADQSAVIAPGSTFQIQEDATGGIYKWDGSKMVIATGADIARVSVATPYDFTKNPAMNNEGWVKAYGPVEMGDMITTTLQSQLKAAIQALKCWMPAAGWTSRSDPATAETNENSPSYGAGHWSTNPDEGDSNATMADAIAAMKAEETNYLVERDNLPPISQTYYHNYVMYLPDGHQTGIFDGPEGFATVARYAYPYITATDAMQTISHTIEVFGFGKIDTSDPPNEEPSLTLIDDDGVISSESKFDAHGTAMKFHQWASLGTWSYAGQAIGAKVIGPKIGSTDCEDPAAVLPPSPASPDYATINDSYNSEGSGYTGYIVSDQAVIVTWDFGGFA